MTTAAEALARETTVAAACDAKLSEHHGDELKRGALANALAMLASNFRGIFTFLIARLLGPAALGTFSVGWATTDILTKFGTFGLEDTITTFIARAAATHESNRASALARLAIFLAVAQCTLLALAASVVVHHLPIDSGIAASILILVWAMPGVALYRVSTAVSRGMKVMRHDIFSRGLTEPLVTTAAFLVFYSLGQTYAPQFAAIIGTAASGIVAVSLAVSLFRRLARSSNFPVVLEARRLLGYGAQITSYELLNSLIVRVDVLMLACFIGKAPGVTLPVVGIYAAVVEIAGGLRKVNQIFNPIFAPVVAGMTVEGEQERASAAFAHVAEWMGWVLAPLIGAIVFAGPLILGIYGRQFSSGSNWLIIVSVACAMNALASLAETVIMVQRPSLNLRNSFITCAIAFAGNVLLIRSLGALGAAFGILLPYLVFAVLRTTTLQRVFAWRNPWRDLQLPLRAAALAAIPAIVIRFVLHGAASQVVSATAFLLTYFLLWRLHRQRAFA